MGTRVTQKGDVPKIVVAAGMVATGDVRREQPVPACVTPPVSTRSGFGTTFPLSLSLSVGDGAPGIYGQQDGLPRMGAQCTEAIGFFLQEGARA